jgi:hypothetical protein
MNVRPAIMRRPHERPGSRTRVRGLAILAVLTFLAVLVPAGAASASAAAPAGDTPIVTIFLTNSSSFCVDLRGNDNNAGAIAELYPCKSSKSDHWLDVAGLQCGDGGANICTEFIDSKHTSECLSMNSARNVVLQNCGLNGNNDPDESEWILDTGTEDGWRNFQWGPNGDMAVAANKANEFLHGTSYPCNCWLRWSVS